MLELTKERNSSMIYWSWQIHLTTERMLLRRPARRWSCMRWQQQQCCRICRCARFFPFAACNFRFRDLFITFCRSKKKFPLQSVSKKARPSGGPRPRAGFNGVTVTDIVIPQIQRLDNKSNSSSVLSSSQIIQNTWNNWKFTFAANFLVLVPFFEIFIQMCLLEYFDVKIRYIHICILVNTYDGRE